MTFHSPLPPVAVALKASARAVRRRKQMLALLDAAIERAIALRDALDGDPDFEDDGTAEPSLGAPETYAFGSDAYRVVRVRGRVHRIPLGDAGDQSQWSRGNHNDAEDDAGENPEEVNEDGGNILDEPHDAEEDCDPTQDIATRPDPEARSRARKARQQLRAICARHDGLEGPRGDLRLILPARRR